MQSQFTRHTPFNDLHVFESENILAVVGPNAFSGRREHHLQVAIYKRLPLAEIPEVVVELARACGVERGILTRRTS